ncbi:MAG: homogentisate phytyltransferase [Bacteroidota bacterium]
MIRTFVQFARLHTLVGTSLSIIALFLMAQRVAVTSDDYVLLGWTLLACLLANVYITGLNQLTDIEIDKINKPYLPLASGAYTVRQAQWIVGVCGVLSLVLASLFPPYLTATVVISLLIGTAYSVQPIRLKRFHFWAAFCIIAVRGLVVNLLIFLHFNYYRNGSWEIPAEVQILTLLIFGYSMLIAWFKDLPDTAGDEAYNIHTLSIKWGRKRVWLVGSWLFGLLLLGVSAYLHWGLGQLYLAIGQLLLLLAYFGISRQLQIDDQRSIARFYQGFWILFFAEYLLFGLLA